MEETFKNTGSTSPCYLISERGNEDMKMNSSNIKVYAGFLVVQNLNWFPNENGLTKEFLGRIVSRISAACREHLPWIKGERNAAEGVYEPLLSISTPIIGRTDNPEEYVLKKGRIWWGGKMFCKGYVFRFDED